MKSCASCGTTIPNHKKYCDNVCQGNHTHKLYIKSWQAGNQTGDRGLITKNISQHIVRYIKDKYNGVCSLCGWHEINPHTGTVPLEIDHIDGNASNNVESNLRVPCPNCHSLTKNYKNSNKGNGRSWRRDRYKKVRLLSSAG